ncbi:MAG: phage portal protein [Clostridia bacterium]|nr:phage portal protein [Clostridia bacterium]
MALKFFDFLHRKHEITETHDITCREMFEAAQDYQMRELCFWWCVNMIANAMGRCEFRTFRGNVEIRESEYYTWNVEPNTNQNATAFMHKLIAMMCTKGEALIINTSPNEGRETLVVADEYEEPKLFPAKQNEYTGVRVGELAYTKTFRERDVMHVRLNHVDIRPVLNGLYASYYRLVDAAMRAYNWTNGQHWKVHVSQIAKGSDFEKKFAQMLQEQFKPFVESNGAILPEFDGYAYENVGKTSQAAQDTRDIKALFTDILEFTAGSFNIPAVLMGGKVEGTKDANTRFLTNCIDPICDQLGEEATRKRYGYDRWKNGDYIMVDSSAIIHFDLFENAANVEKLIGSGGFTINDVRRAAGQAVINEPWANKHFMTLNISDMSQSTRQLENGEGGENSGE